MAPVSGQPAASGDGDVRFRGRISLTHVPYKGATQAATDVAAGQIPVAFQGLGTVAALVRGGQVRLIGSPRRTGCRNSQMCPPFPNPVCRDSSSILVRHSRPRRHAEGHHRKADAEALKAVGDPTFAASSRIWVSRCVEARRRSCVHDTRSACKVRARDQGNGYRERNKAAAAHRLPAAGSGFPQ